MFTKQDYEALQILLNQPVAVFNAFRQQNSGRVTLICLDVTKLSKDLSDIDFSNVTLTKSDFSGKRLVNASFKGADLTHASFRYADLTNADFTGATLVGTNFAFCKGLRRATFDHTVVATLNTIQFSL